MGERQIQNAAEISEMERRDLGGFRQLSLEERGQLLAAACRDAAAIERSRLDMALPVSRGAPWPDSTWRFLAEAMRRVREE